MNIKESSASAFDGGIDGVALRVFHGGDIWRLYLKRQITKSTLTLRRLTKAAIIGYQPSRNHEFGGPAYILAMVESMFEG